MPRDRITLSTARQLVQQGATAEQVAGMFDIEDDTPDIATKARQHLAGIAAGADIPPGAAVPFNPEDRISHDWADTSFSAHRQDVPGQATDKAGNVLHQGGTAPTAGDRLTGMAKGVLTGIIHPVERDQAMLEGSLDEARRAKAAFNRPGIGSKVEAFGHALATIPGIGKAAAAPAEDFVAGDVGAAAGGVAPLVAGPMAARALGEIVPRGMSAASEGLTDAAVKRGAKIAYPEYPNGPLSAQAETFIRNLYKQGGKLVDPKGQMLEAADSATSTDVSDLPPTPGAERAPIPAGPTPRGALVSQAAIDRLRSMVGEEDAPYDGNPRPNPMAAYDYAREHPGGGMAPSVPTADDLAGASRYRPDPTVGEPTLSANRPQGVNLSPRSTGMDAAPSLPPFTRSGVPDTGSLRQMADALPEKGASSPGLIERADAAVSHVPLVGKPVAAATGLSVASDIAKLARDFTKGGTVRRWQANTLASWGRALRSGDAGALAEAASRGDQEAAGISDPSYGAVAHLTNADLLALYGGIDAAYLDPDGHVTMLDLRRQP